MLCKTSFIYEKISNVWIKVAISKISLTNVNALIIIMNVNRIVIVLSDKLDLLNYKVYEIVRIFYS